MKKIFACILVLAIILGINTISFAQIHTNNEMGISFIISDDWEWYKNEANEIIYKRKFFIKSPPFFLIISQIYEQIKSSPFMGKIFPRKYAKIE